MRNTVQARDVDGSTEPTHTVEVVCAHCGYDLDEAVRRVHINNMGRMLQPDGTIKRREDGKIIKNPDYPKVKLDDLV